MNFLHPALLFFLPLVLVPIILHLITLHRLKTIELSTFRFLFDSYLRQRSHMKFMDALLTALRTLFLLLLVLAIGRPVLKHWSAFFAAKGDRDRILLIDCSASMNASTDGVSALERAKAAALAAIARMGRGERVTLIRVSAKPEEIFSRFSADAETLRAKIDALQIGPGRANMLAALRRVYENRGPGGGNPLVYLFTDGQASGWKEALDQGLDRVAPANARLVVVDVGTRRPIPNRAVIGDPPAQKRAIVGLPVILKPRVINASGDETAEVTVNAFVDDQEIGRAAFSLKPGEESGKELVFIPREAGTHRGRFEIAFDRFPDDNSYLFVLPVMPPLKVLLVNGNPSSDPYDNEGLYLRAALTASAEGDAAQPGVKNLMPSKEYLRSLDVQDVAEAHLTAALLKQVSVVILANCGRLTDAQFDYLRAFVADGGGLLIFPGDLADPNRYNDNFFPVPGPQRERLTAAEMDKAEGDPRDARTFERFTAVDFEHPVLAVFNDPAQHYLTTASFYRRFPLALAKGKGGAWALARFADGNPALIESRLGDGIVFLAAFPANVKWGNLPLKPEFVPLILRLVSYAQHRAEFEAPTVVFAESAAEIGVAGDWAPVQGAVTDGAGRSTPLAFQRSGTRLVGTFERAMEKGYYTLDVAGGAAQQPKKGKAILAVNVAAAESDFTALDTAELKRMLPGARISVVDATAEAHQGYGVGGDEREVWRALLALLILIMGIEFTLATVGAARARRTFVTLWRRGLAGVRGQLTAE
jgi:hypothetical protein